MKKLIYLFVGFVAALSIAATSTDSDITGVGGGASAGSSGVGNVDPSGTAWLVGWADFTDNDVLSSGVEYPMGPFSLDYGGSGTGLASSAANGVNAAGDFGVRAFTIPSSASGFQYFRTDDESIIPGTHTYRVGVRVKFEDIPDGTEDYYYFIGLNSKTSNLNSADYAVLGIFRADNSTNFVVKTKDATTENVTDTGVAFASDTWYNLEIEVTPTATSAWIDGTLVLDADTNNQPTAVDSSLAIHNAFRLGSPSATRLVYLDWAYVAIKAGSARGSVGSGGPF